MSGTVLLYTHALVGGGGERLWASLASALADAGYDVVLAEDRTAYENRGLLNSAVRVVTLGGGHMASTRALARLLARERPIAALSAIGASNLKLAAANLMSGSKTPTVLTYHGFDDWKLGKLGFFTYALLPLLSRMSARIVAVSDGLAHDLKTRWRAKPTAVDVIYNPVFFPNTIDVPSADGLARRHNRLLAVGRLVEDKDYPMLLAAMTKLKTDNVTLTVLGDGPLEADLLAQARQLGIADRVTFAGYATEPWPAYAAAKCFVLSSRKEAFGNVIVEAMAYGLPVVATRNAGSVISLDDGRFGRLVPVGDADTMADAIDATLRDPGSPAARVQRAHAFSMAERVPAYVNLIESVRRAERAQPG